MGYLFGEIKIRKDTAFIMTSAGNTEVVSWIPTCIIKNLLI